MPSRYTNELLDACFDDVVLWLETSIESPSFPRSYKIIRAYLLLIAARIVGSPLNRCTDCESDEIVDSLFCQLKERCGGGYRIRRPYRQFFLGSLHHQAVSKIRRRSVRRTTYHPLEMIPADSCPSQRLTGQQERRRLLTALRRLEFTPRVTLVGQYWRGRTAREAAERSNVSIATINRRRTEGRVALAEILAAMRQPRAA